MAIQQKEKTLIGIVMTVGAIGLVVGVGLPQWDAYSAHTAEIATLNDDIKNNTANRDNLKAQIALLENKTAIPEGIVIESFTEANREAVIKKILDHIVGISGQTGNQFISLLPKDVDPIVSTEKPADPNNAAKSNPNGTTTPTATDNAATANPNGDASATSTPAPAPLLSTFGYEISIRGTYDTIQQFLKTIAQQKTMMEISSINLANESNNDANTANPASAAANPAYPIRLTAKFRLALQQVGI